ncbi:Sugar phosphate isomerase/epimerase [Haladaptatus litoreus]|uniref:Sugar phosphate isomerase/epimerase n=1 Tax=Haladaptatus litoreus TaxID=553468 RepID=A0A1N6XT95_9EURY|nr:sugar phosphate isomerase/epimerase [Haladaptatus litoreus]SIR05401.1 Sugar phosphate isomerase/epimerase [Haladaptatus litoreus]
MDAKTGFVTQIGMEYEEAFEIADDLGFDYVELMMDGATERQHLDSDAVRVRAEECDIGLAVHLPFALDIGSPFEHVREGAIREVRAAVETASAFGANKGVLHASSRAWKPAWDVETVGSNILQSVREIDEFAADLGFEICVENIPSGWFSIHDFDRIFDETDASMTLDTGHARIDGLDSGGMASFVGEHSDRISHFHLNDTRLAKDEHLPFGAGTIDFRDIFAALPDDWGGTLSLEVFTLEYGYIETSKTYLDKLL